MIRLVQMLAVGMIALTLSTGSTLCAENEGKVRVALLDMSASMPTGMMGYGMMGPGMMGAAPWMMGPGGMMGYGPGGPGPGYGMMGPGMMMMSVRIDHSTVKAGPVTFDVTNWSRSALHEMLVVAIDNPTAPLPYDYARALVPEDQVKVLFEMRDLQPNQSQSLELTLTPGTYLLLCNLPGHYAAGMATTLNVTP